MEWLILIAVIVIACAVWAWSDARHAIALDERRKREESDANRGRPHLVSVLQNVTVDRRADIRTALDEQRWN